MGSQLNLEFTPSSWVCSYHYHNDVTFSSPQELFAVTTEISEQVHVALEAGHRLPHVSPVHVRVESRRWNVSDLL